MLGDVTDVPHVDGHAIERTEARDAVGLARSGHLVVVLRAPRLPTDVDLLNDRTANTISEHHHMVTSEGADLTRDYV